QRARRPSPKARSPRRSPRRIRARGSAYAQRPRARLVAGACPIMHARRELTRMGALSSSLRFLARQGGLRFFRDQDNPAKSLSLFAFGVPSTPRKHKSRDTHPFSRNTRKEGGAPA